MRHLCVAGSMIAHVLTLALAGAPAAGQHRHERDADDPPSHESHHAHEHPEAEPAASFREAVDRIRRHVVAVDAAVETGNMDVHEDADGIATLARSLGALAMAGDSGVERARVRDASALGKDLATVADAFHAAADGGDITEARRAWTRLLPVVDRLAAFVPAKYYCPMWCEGEGTLYEGPGRCPVCNMALKLAAAAPERGVEVVPRGELAPGRAVTIALTTTDPAGALAGESGGAEGRPGHVTIVSEDLAHFAEARLARTDDGHSFEWTAPVPGTFFVFYGATPAGAGPAPAPAKLRVPGEAAERAPLVPDLGEEKPVAGHGVRLSAAHAPLRARGEEQLVLSVERGGASGDDAESLDLNDARLVLVSEDLEHLFEAERRGGGALRDRGEGDGPGAGARFRARFPEPGLYRAWAVLGRGGSTVATPFTLEVIPESGARNEGDHRHGQ